MPITENSPAVTEGIECWLEEKGPARKKRPSWIWILVVFGFLSLLLIIWSRISNPAKEDLGGLDGCLATAEGAPVQATVQIGDHLKNTGEDGCFFFNDLKAGNAELKIIWSSGERLIPVTIVKGQAVGLDQITVGGD